MTVASQPGTARASNSPLVNPSGAPAYLGQPQCPFKLDLDRRRRLQPAEPPVIGEHGLAHPAPLVRGDVAPGLERVAQDRIGRMLAVGRADHTLGQPEDECVHTGEGTELTLYAPPSNCRNT